MAELAHTDGKGTNSDRILTSLVFLGGTGNESPTTIGVDAKGRIHVIGRTASTDFPVTPDAFQTEYGGGPADLFFTVLSPSNEGSQGPVKGENGPAFSSFSGGDGDEDTTAKGVTVEVVDPRFDQFSCSAIFGITTSSNPPVTSLGNSQAKGPIFGTANGIAKIFCENPAGGTPSFLDMYGSLFDGPISGGDAWLSENLAARGRSTMPHFGDCHPFSRHLGINNLHWHLSAKKG